MTLEKYISDFMNMFSNSYINRHNELIVEPKLNEYMNISSVENELDFKCKVIERLSRATHKTQWYKSQKFNDKYNKLFLCRCNSYLGVNFNENEWSIIYTYLGNGVNHELTKKFIESGYDLSLLKR